jgi:hypothetical protein
MRSDAIAVAPASLGTAGAAVQALAVEVRGHAPRPLTPSGAGTAARLWQGQVD